MKIAKEIAKVLRVTTGRNFDAHGAILTITTCLDCGAALVVDPGDREDTLEIHRRWHAKATK